MKDNKFFYNLVIYNKQISFLSDFNTIKDNLLNLLDKILKKNKISKNFLTNINLYFLYMRIYFIFFLLEVFNELNGNLNVKRFYNRNNIKNNINSNNLRVYFACGISHRINTRNTNKILENIHRKYGARDFTNVMSNKNGKTNNGNNGNGFSYTYNIPSGNGINNEPKNYSMSDEQFKVMYEYYSQIFSETAKDNSGNIRFKIKTINNGNNITNTNYIESATYFSSINTLCNLNGWIKNNDLKRSRTILFINNIHSSLWKRGINNYSGENLTITNNNSPSEYIIIDDQKMKKEKYDILSTINTLMGSGASKIHKHFIWSIIRIVEDKKKFFFQYEGTNYYLIDKDLNYYIIEEKDLDFNQNTPVIKKIKKIGKIKDLDALEKEYNDPTTKPIKENDTITYDEYLSLMDKNIFQGSNPNTNILTFLILNLQENQNASIQSFQTLIERIHDNNNTNNKNIYDFNRDNIDSSLFFLFGYHGKLQEHSLPYDCYVKNVENFEEDKNDKKKNLLKESDKYNIPSYTTKNENIISLYNGMLTLPQTEPFHINQLGPIVSILLLKGNFSLLLSLEYMPIINNVSINIPMRQMTNDVYFTIFLGYKILDSLYIGPNITIMSAKYFLHKYFDISYGINITSTLFPLVITLYYSYDIANNTCSFSLNAQLATKVYGHDDFIEEENNEPTYVEFL